MYHSAIEFVKSTRNIKLKTIRAKYIRPINEHIGRILEMLNIQLEEYWKMLNRKLF